MIRSFAFALLLASPAAAQDLVAPVHGNWCGPGWGAGMPVDLIDAACQRHDLCIGAEGFGACGCDIAFMQDMVAVPKMSRPQQELARALYEAIALSPCTDPVLQAQKTDMAIASWSAAVASGYEPPWAVLDRLGALAARGLGLN